MPRADNAAVGRLLLTVLALAAPTSPASTSALPIGRPVTLGFEGSRLQVTLMQYIDPARSCCYRPRKGTRFVAFKIRYVNLERFTQMTIPAADVELVDSRGRVYSSISLTYGNRMRPWPVLAPTLNHGLKLTSRARVTGYLGWVLPSTLRLREFRYSFGGYQTARWRLR
jgi:hypothetical protein